MYHPSSSGDVIIFLLVFDTPPWLDVLYYNIYIQSVFSTHYFDAANEKNKIGEGFPPQELSYDQILVILNKSYWVE